MLFVEPRFFLFFAVVLTVYWSLRSNASRKLFLLLASIVFYSAWDWRFCAMLLALASADWFFALRIAHTEHPLTRKRFVSASLAMNLSVLAYFKYAHFFLSSTVALAARMHLQLTDPTLRILLPVGISFFTFQSLSYTIDVYRREIPPVPHLRDYLMFATFFPQLVAGPIVRPKYFVPQMASARTLTPAEIQHALYLFLLGYIKKTCIADNLSPYVDRVFDHPAPYSAASSITAAWLYATQIFCDFSGYSDMAIAVAALLGYKLVLNFDAPYLATSIQDFWRRWHISLSTWIRDYIYLSLGGRSATNRLLTYRNILLTMLAGGLWHGAAWTFVAWGGLHGAGQIIQQEFRRAVPVQETQDHWRKPLGWFLTINFVCLCWILFRAPDFPTALLMSKRYLFLDRGGTETIPLWLAAIGPALLCAQAMMRRLRVDDRICALSLNRFALAYGAAWALVLSLLPLGYRPFLYFQF